MAFEIEPSLHLNPEVVTFFVTTVVLLVGTVLVALETDLMVVVWALVATVVAGVVFTAVVVFDASTAGCVVVAAKLTEAIAVAADKAII